MAKCGKFLTSIKNILGLGALLSILDACFGNKFNEILYFIVQAFHQVNYAQSNHFLFLLKHKAK